MTPASKKKKTLKRKLIWAFDPTQDPEDSKKIISELRIWSKRLDCQIQPVFVFSLSPLNFFTDLKRKLDKNVETYAQETATRYLKKCSTEGFLPAEILFSKSFSNRIMAVELSKFAEKTNATMIFTYTHVKQSWNLVRLGGFAETLVAKSRTPVLLLNSLSLPAAASAKILFPTDFSKESKAGLRHLTALIKPLRSEVLIFNQIPRPFIYGGTFPGHLSPIDLLAATKSTEELRIKKAKELIHELDTQGVKSESIVQKQKKSLGYDIAEVAKKNQVNLIAFAGQGGPLSELLIAGTVRDVILHSLSPVLIFNHRKGKGIQKRKN